MKTRMPVLLLVVVLLIIVLSAVGCKKQTTAEASKYQKYTHEFMDAFDTVIQLIAYTKDESEFEGFVLQAKERYEELHKLFNKYDDYPGINNIKTINDNAGISPVVVEEEIIDLILFSKEWYVKTSGVVNIALGPVLSIWHDYREEGRYNPVDAKLPPIEELQKAAAATDIDKVIVDKKNNTVFLTEPGMSLDVGAVAKGFATEIVARELEERGLKSCIINCGGNIRLIGKPLDGTRNKWGIGIQNPDGNVLIPDDEPLDTVFATDTSLVTSGDYQRYYVVDGQVYHHLIDPYTLMPANHYRAVMVMVRDSGIADIMSSAAFLLPFQQSRELVESIDGLEAVWIFADGTLEATAGMRAAMKIMGGASGK